MDKNNLNDMSDPQRKIYKQTYGDNLKSMAASMTKIIIVSSAYQILGKQHLNKKIWENKKVAGKYKTLWPQQYPIDSRKFHLKNMWQPFSKETIIKAASS